MIDEVLTLTRNIYQTYLDVPDYLKRHYLRFFFEGIYIKDKRIARVVEAPLFSTLRRQEKVIIRSNWLPTSQFTLYKIFTKKSVAKVKTQLETLKEILRGKPNYSMVKVTNGQFCKIARRA